MITRRQFLKAGGAVMGSALLSAKSPADAAMVSEEPLLAGGRELRFNAQGRFKIAQFTDLHLNGEKPEGSKPVHECVNRVLDAEHPDFIIFTGDIVCCGNGTGDCLSELLSMVNGCQIPFGIVFGNHDDEKDLSREQLMEIARKYAFNCSWDEEPSIHGVSNYVLPVRSSDGTKEAALLYCLDSNAYSQMEGVDGYDYIRRDQVEWYVRQSEKHRERNGKPLPALAFFHIPIPEYKEASLFEETNFYGIRGEHVASPLLNSGLFTAMKEQGDVMGVFVGHEHDNDFIVGWKGIALAYGRYAGTTVTTYGHLPNGSRLIELEEGERRFNSWIRTAHGTEQLTRFPDDFWKMFKK